MISRDKLRNCLFLAGNNLKHDSALLYQLYIQNIGTEGHGSNIVKNYSCTKNAYKLHRYFCGYCKNKAYLSNKATEADHNLKAFSYRGVRTRFIIEEYYKRLTEAFTDLAHAEASHDLNKHQKVLKYENGLQNNSANWEILLLLFDP